MATTLFEAGTAENAPSLHEAFRRVYYHLYSNSNASRAERLFDDIAKLLLVKVLAETDGVAADLARFLDGSSSADDAIMPALRHHYPDTFREGDCFAVQDDALRLALLELESVAISRSPSAALGEAFQALVGPRLRGDKGQFFTPRELVRCMVRVASPQPDDKIVDPAAGTGGFLAEAHAYRVEKHPRKRKFAPLVGIEKDQDIQRLGSAMLLAVSKGVGSIHQGNSLDICRILSERTEIGDADIVLTNPPFGARIGVKERDILAQYDMGHNWSFSPSTNAWVRQNSLRGAQDPQILFLELCLKLLKPSGLLGIVLPEGVFGNRKSGYIWDFVRSCASIEAMIDCPRTTFQPGTDTKTNVVFIRKFANDGINPESNGIAIAVAKSCGHDRRGRHFTSFGEAVSNDFNLIESPNAQGANGVWSWTNPSDRFYLVPRYHHGQIKNPAVGLAKELGGEVTTLGEMVRRGYLRVRKGHEVGAEAYGSGDVPFVRTSDIHNWEVSLNPTNGISEEHYGRFATTQNLRSHDILLVVDGRYKIGRTAILHNGQTKCVVQSHFRILTVRDKSPIDAFELLYLLSRSELLSEMRNLVFIQSTLGSIGKRLEELLIPLPHRTAQWRRAVEEFRSALETRARSLETLRAFDQPIPEL